MKLKHETPEEALTYRTPLEVTQIIVTEDNYSFPICPRCGISFEREYQAYCDRCGQRLGWKRYGRAKVVRVK